MIRKSEKRGKARAKFAEKQRQKPLLTFLLLSVTFCFMSLLFCLVLMFNLRLVSMSSFCPSLRPFLVSSVSLDHSLLHFLLNVLSLSSSVPYLVLLSSNLFLLCFRLFFYVFFGLNMI